jgi:polyhydroxyalkanoate synthesis repressor PhaR
MRTIKRYSNRKLYDLADSHYVTLAQIAAIIRAGEDVQVLEHPSGRDLTAATMAQILFEEERRALRIGPGRATRNHSDRTTPVAMATGLVLPLSC